MTFWDRISGVYDLAERFNQKAVRGMARETARRVPAGSRFLECAAGTGEISLAAAHSAGEVLCTDLSSAMLERAKLKAARLGLGNIAFARRDLLRLPEADRSFDAVCAGNVLHLLEDPEAAVRELRRVTAAGGVLLLPTFLMGEAGPWMRFLVRLYRLAGFRFRRSFTAQSYAAFFDGIGIPPEEMVIIPGRMPVGLAVIRKPA